MGRPQDQDLQRSGNTPIDPDHIATEVETQPHAPRDEPGGGPIPTEQQPGHHPPVEQDKPDLDAFAERMGIETDDDVAADDGVGDDAGENESNGGGHGAVDKALSVAASARELAEPVAQLVQDGMTRLAQKLDDRRSLVDRVERLEEQVAELTERLGDR
jgi:hypothetical protein